VRSLLQSFEGARPHEAGFVRPLDGLVHAVARRLAGNIALCGAGRIETELVGRFDPEAADACPACASLVATGGTPD
jgi:hypothetical protein